MSWGGKEPGREVVTLVLTIVGLVMNRATDVGFLFLDPRLIINFHLNVVDVKLGMAAIHRANRL